MQIGSRFVIIKHAVVLKLLPSPMQDDVIGVNIESDVGVDVTSKF